VGMPHKIGESGLKADVVQQRTNDCRGDIN